MFQNPTLTQTNNILHAIVIEARQRQLHRRLMNELLASVKSHDASGKQTSELYRTMTWEM